MKPIPTTALELAKVLNTSPSNLRQRLSEANGQINFNPETDELTPGQLATWLPRYVAEGTKTYFKDERKRAMVYELLSQLNGNKPKTEPQTKSNGTPEPKTTEQQTERQTQKARPKQSKLDAFIALLPILPLPTLGIAASWGVFHFANVFSPTIIAIFEAVGFELVYIGLSTLRDLPDKFRKYRQYVSLGAVAVSVVYNSLSAWLVLQPDLFDSLHFGWQIAVSVAHGLPIAVLGYFVADLISIVKNHQK